MPSASGQATTNYQPDNPPSHSLVDVARLGSTMNEIAPVRIRRRSTTDPDAAAEFDRALILWRETEKHIDECYEAVYRARLRIAWRVARGTAEAQGRLLDAQASPLSSILDAPEPKPTFMDLGLPKRVELPVLPAVFPYDPDADRPARRHRPSAAADEPDGVWPAVIQLLDCRLGLNILLPEDPPHFSDKLFGLLDPGAEWPTFTEVVDFETSIAEGVLRYMIEYSEEEAYALLRKEKFLTKVEAIALLSIARQIAKESTSVPEDENRAMMVMRLRRIQQRSKEVFNVREEINALKLEAQLTGLTRNRPEELEDVFAQVVRASDRLSTDRVIDTRPSTRQLADPS